MSDPVESQRGSPNFLKLKSELLKHPDGVALYEDPNFSAKYDVLFNNENTDINKSDIIWRRPGQLSKTPCLLKSDDDQSTRFYPGKLTPFWFPILIALLKEKNMFEFVIPNLSNQNTFDQESYIITPARMSYCGAFQFTFRRGGKLERVIIDDRLPTTVNCHLLSAISSNNEEFLPALIEKAYAKFLGGYYHLEKENFFTAVMDFTGGVAESISKSIKESILPEHASSFYQKIVNLSGNSYAICQMNTTELFKKKSENKDKLYQIYSINGYTEIPLDPPDGLIDDIRNYLNDSRGSLISVVRLKPLENFDENGFLERHVIKNWQKCTTLVKKKYGIECNNSKEQWITVAKLLEISERIVLFHMFTRNSIIAIAKKQPYLNYSFFESFWHRDGPRRGPKIIGSEFLKNNQYLVSVEEETCYVRVVLTNIQRYIEGSANNSQIGGNTQIGIELFEVERNRLYRVHNLEHTKLIACQTDFQIGRYLIISTNLERGRYVIIPWISAGPGTKYTLQMFTSESSTEVRFLDLDIPRQQLCITCQVKQTAFRTQNSFKSLYERSDENGMNMSRKVSTIEPDICQDCKSIYPKHATRISVIGANWIRLTANYQLPNFFFKISCENEAYISKMTYNSLNPQWNEHFLFFRISDENSKMNIQLFCENKLGFKSRIFDYFFAEKELRDKCKVCLPLQEETSIENDSEENRIIIEIENYFLSEFNDA